MAQLTWTAKLASFYLHLAKSSEGAYFGRFVYGLFWLHGVEGLPPLNPNRVPNDKAGIDRLPVGYGSAFGEKAMNRALFVGKSVQRASEILSAVSTKLSNTSDAELDNRLRGRSLKDAEGYVASMISTLAIDMVRSDTRQKRDTRDTSPYDALEMVLKDQKPSDLDEMISKHKFDKVLDEVARQIDPELVDMLPDWIDLRSEGVSDTKIVNDQMLPYFQKNPMSVQNWNLVKMKMRKIVDKLEKFEKVSCVTVDLVESTMEKTRVVKASELTLSTTSLLVQKTAKEFSSPEALKEYLHDHPNADPGKHQVKKEEKSHKDDDDAQGYRHLKVDKGTSGDVVKELPAHMRSTKRKLENGQALLDAEVDKVVRTLKDKATHPGVGKEDAARLRGLAKKLQDKLKSEGHWEVE